MALDKDSVVDSGTVGSPLVGARRTRRFPVVTDVETGLEVEQTGEVCARDRTRGRSGVVCVLGVVLEMGLVDLDF